MNAAAEELFAIYKMRACIETGEVARDSFGQTVTKVYCGRWVPGFESSHQFLLLHRGDPMFYSVCGSCKRVKAARDRVKSRLSGKSA